MSRRASRLGATAAAVLAAAAAPLPAQSLTVSGDPGPLNVTSALAGAPPAAAADASTTYTVTTVARSKIAVQIDTPMSGGLTLRVTLAAPAGATSVGPVTLSTTAQDAVNGIPVAVLSTNGITYAFSATVAAGVVPPSSRVVTLTLLPDP